MDLRGTIECRHVGRGRRRCLLRPLLLFYAAVLLVPTGCVQRRLLIRSDPPGAVVYVDHERVGTTPCAVNYVYYGTRKIRLVKDGFETLVVEQPLPTPWYEVPPLDLVSDVLVPYEIRDVRSVTYRLQPQYIIPQEHLLARAEELRLSTQAGTPTAGERIPLSPSPGAETLPPSGQPVYVEQLPVPGESFPGPLLAPPVGQQPAPGAETLPPGGLEYVPVE